ncbi:Symplekin tight junction protein C terminal-domain-containing protein [Naematelia encephala]|uniref:Symplekin tight junction protein C terminal-domain-containing protein n=1 Tax=Naematelia encephala TaxID=71784 RepID=A0A1Y2B1U7_9TREE|nr:Symplekin tight junction protein C terminal-domain-containing protein [Naematelia encephala]
MSLYTDTDLSLALEDQPSGSTSLLAPPPPPTLDPIQALGSALSAPSDTASQAEAFVAASRAYEANPDRLPELCAQLLPVAWDSGEGLLRGWVLDMIGLAVGRSGLNGEIKLQVIQQSLEILVRMLSLNSAATLRALIPIFSTIYPLLFRLLSTPSAPRQLYELFQQSKSRILSLALDPNSQPQSAGVKAAAWKYVQKVLLAGTRAGAADPRLRGKAPEDPNVSNISPGSPLNPSELEEEATRLRGDIVGQLYTASNPAILHPIFQIIPGLCKSRPTLSALFVAALASWTPAHLEATHVPLMQIRAVEKTVRMVMTHLVRHPPLVGYAPQLNEAMMRQRQRMDVAWQKEREERRARLGGSVKHELDGETMGESSEMAAKRARMDVVLGSGKGRGMEVDVTTLPVDAVVETVIGILEIAPDDFIRQAFENARIALRADSVDVSPLLASSLGLVKDEIKDEDETDLVLDPLDMDVDDDEDLLYADDDADEPAEDAVAFTEFTLPPPTPFQSTEKEEILDTTIQRIWEGGSELASLPDDDIGDGIRLAVQPKEIWMLLLARLTTRGAGAEGKRKAVIDFVMADFTNRLKFASVWLNEEWYNDKLFATSNYPTHLESILSTYLASTDSKDKALSAFLSSLPELSPSVITSLESLCLDTSNSLIGFVALQDLVDSRPPVRPTALALLLELCTHPDRKTRVLAIRTVRKWVGKPPMSTQVTNYALGVLRRLISGDETPESHMDVEDGEEADEAINSRFLPAADAIDPDSVPQHVELVFALCLRLPDLLDDVFRTYPKMALPVQEQVESLLTPLIAGMGANAKLLEVVRKFPPGADKLALRVISVLGASGGGASTGVLVNLIKGLMAERELDPRFIIPIVGQLDKAEIEKQIPRIVGLLGTSDDSRDLVRNAFASVLQKITPADLLVALHTEEGGLKATIEAIGICFSLTSIFRSDVLASAMSRIADLPSLPVVFLRTVIQAVTTYKSLIPFIANNVLPKLIGKKIWETPQLWDGFIRLAKMIAPHSFGALCQLPKEQLKEVLSRQPGLQDGLRAYLVGKGQTKTALAEVRSAF